MVSTPRSGKPRDRSTDTSISSKDSPTMTSGITSGALTMPVNKVRPVNRWYLTSEKAASVPSSTDEHAVKKAIFIDSKKAEIISSSAASAPYHFRVKPRHEFGTGESLNEYTTSARMGRYKKTKPSASQPVPNQRCKNEPFICAPRRLRPGTC